MHQFSSLYHAWFCLGIFFAFVPYLLSFYFLGTIFALSKTNNESFSCKLYYTRKKGKSLNGIAYRVIKTIFLHIFCIFVFLLITTFNSSIAHNLFPDFHVLCSSCRMRNLLFLSFVHLFNVFFSFCNPIVLCIIRNMCMWSICDCVLTLNVLSIVCGKIPHYTPIQKCPRFFNHFHSCFVKYDDDNDAKSGNGIKSHFFNTKHQRSPSF